MIVCGPDFSGLGLLLWDYDPMYPSVPAVSEINGLSGGVATKQYRIFDRSGNQNHATTLDAGAEITLLAAGVLGRIGYRFQGTGAYMPPAMFVGLNAVEVWAVVQPFEIGVAGGFHCLGDSANNLQATEYVDAGSNILDDTLSDTLSTGAAAGAIAQPHLVQISSTGLLKSIWYDGAAIVAADPGLLATPSLPVVGAGRSAAGAVSNAFNGVVLRYLGFSAAVTANARAAGVTSVQSFYGTP